MGLTRRAAIGAGLSLATDSRLILAQGAQSRVQTGGARTVRVQGRWDVWVKRVGSGSVPVLLLHGGPGFNHFYLECFEDFVGASGTTFWYYDQLGCGFSDRPADPALWTIPRYCAEVEEVRQTLGLERFVLYGHSWGAMLALEYALQHPARVSGLVVSNMADSVEECERYAASLIEKLPFSIQEEIASYRKRGAFSDPKYQELLIREVYQRHFCRLNPWPEPVRRTLRTVNQSIYETLSGPDEFDVTGTLKDWSISPEQLRSLRMPALLIGARYDEMPPARIESMAQMMPGARYALCEQGSHLAMYDDQQAYFQALTGFLRNVGKRPV